MIQQQLTLLCDAYLPSLLELFRPLFEGVVKGDRSRPATASNDDGSMKSDGWVLNELHLVTSLCHILKVEHGFIYTCILTTFSSVYYLVVMFQALMK